MGKRVICTVFLFLVFVLTQSPAWAQENQIVNSEFEDGLDGWGRYGTTGFDVEVVQDAGLSGATAALIDVTDASATASIGIAQSGLVLEPGETYPIGFTARAAQDREMVVLLQTNVNNASWPTQLNQKVNLSPTAETYVLEYTHSGNTLGDDETETVTLYLMLKGQWWPMEGDDLDAKVWIDRVYFGEEPPLPRRDLATKPSPEDGATDVERDGDLSWTPGAFAQTHDVYLGTVFDDVNTASRTSPMDILLSQGQSTTAFDPGRLAFDQTYYWRVDEVNGLPDNAVIKGTVWSFTTEPLAYPIADVNATSNGTPDVGAGPENMVNGSGLNAADQHSTVSTDMWLASPAGDEPIQIQFALDRVYKLHEMLIWNYNVQFELLLGFGIKNVTVEYSENGSDWTTLGDVDLIQATASADYAANTTVDMQGVAAQYVRLTVNSGFGMMGKFGLSEVRFMQIPAHARKPQPDDGATGVSVDSTLAWRAGRDAASHEVYLDTDEQAVLDDTVLADTVETANFVPSNLEFGATYYWKVNEVNETQAVVSWGSDLWSFSTQEYAVVEDFESYDDEENRIYDAWLDGWVNETGSTVGYLEAPFAEQTIVNSGSQSMPLAYDNTNSPFYSEAEYEFSSQNWTTNGADTLVLHVHGVPPTFVERADGSMFIGSTGGDIWGTADAFRLVYKRLSGNGSIVTRVDSIVNTSGWAKGGVMIRESLDAGSTHAMVVVTPGNGVALQHRPTTNQASLSINEADLTAPYWVKLTRTGDTLTAERSEDGTNWVSITADASASSVEIPMTGEVFIGLALVSNNSGASPTAANFSNVSTTGNVSGVWQVEDIGGGQLPSNDPASMYIVIEDRTGKTTTVTSADADLAVTPVWQAWEIPFSALSGVDLSSVSKMTIGVGDRDNPTASGTGLVYIDDIQFGHPLPAAEPEESAGQ